MRRMVPTNEWVKVKNDIEQNKSDIKQLKGVEVENITQISSEVLDALKPGDLVVKITGNLKHTYRVTYKEEKHGICISYYAAGYLETVSYDYNSVTGKWVYNSTDVFNAEDFATEAYVTDAINTAVLGAINDTY